MYRYDDYDNGDSFGAATGRRALQSDSTRTSYQSSTSRLYIDKKFRPLKIVVFRNGDALGDSGTQLFVTEKAFPEWVAFLEFLTKRLKVPAAVSRLFRVSDQQQQQQQRVPQEIRSFSELRDGESYVAVAKFFTPGNYVYAPRARKERAWNDSTKVKRRDATLLDSLESRKLVPLTKNPARPYKQPTTTQRKPVFNQYERSGFAGSQSESTLSIPKLSRYDSFQNRSQLIDQLQTRLDELNETQRQKEEARTRAFDTEWSQEPAVAGKWIFGGQGRPEERSQQQPMPLEETNELVATRPVTAKTTQSDVVPTPSPEESSLRRMILPTS